MNKKVPSVLAILIIVIAAVVAEVIIVWQIRVSLEQSMVTVTPIIFQPHKVK